MKPWTLRELRSYVRIYGYEIARTKKDYKVIDKNENPIAFFAVSHKKSAKNEIKGPYIKKIIEAIKEDQNND